MKSNRKNFLRLFFIVLIFSIFSGAANFLFPINILEAKNVADADVNSMIERLLAAEHVEGEIIVKFKDEVTINSAVLADVSADAHSQIGATITKEFEKLKGLQHVEIPESIPLRQALESYLQNPLVEYAEPNYIVYATVIPNDPYFSQLWGLHNTGQTGGTSDADIDAPGAWNLTTGSSSVVVAVVDTGVDYNHSDLNANIWRNPGETNCSDGIDNDGNGYRDDCRGWDFANNDNDPIDDNDHGTHVSGTIAAEGNNGNGITGINWTAKIMPLKFLNRRGSGTTADAVSAILYANANGAHVINNSWGGGGYSQAVKDAIDASNAVVVCAAGNDGSNNDATPSYPANYTSANLIAVAATTDTDDLASFSNYGVSSVDLGAPGVSIYSTVRNGGYASFSGTSMATPHVSGVAGLVKALSPGLTNLGIKKTILNNVDTRSSLAGKVLTGGRLNALKALNSVNNPPDISATPASKNFGSVSVDSSSLIQTFTISNTGTGDLVMKAVYLTGTNPYQFSIKSQNCSYTTIAPSGSCTISAAFIPTKTGALRAIIGIGSNDPDTPRLYISLTGTGVLQQVPDIRVTPSSIDFGNVNVGTSSDQTVTVGNSGAADLTIGTVTSPSSPFSIIADNCSGQTLVYSATCTITYRFSPISAATFVSNSNIPSDDPDTPQVTVSLGGAGVDSSIPDISAAPASKDFGSVEVGISVSQTFTISNTGTADLVMKAVYLTGPNPYQFSIKSQNCAYATIAPSGSCTITAAFSPTKTGALSALIGIGSNDPDTPRLYIGLSGTGIVILVGPDISAAPASKDFGPVSVGLSVSQTFTISNIGIADLVIKAVYLTGSNPYQFSIESQNCLTTIAPSGSCTITAAFSPTKTGALSAFIGIGSNDPDTPRLYISLTGTGVQ